MTGLIHIYEGDGKGKTTAAIGLAIRCVGSGRKVLFTQFLKDNSSSELVVLASMENICCFLPSKTLCLSYTEAEKEEFKKMYAQYFAEAIKIADQYDMVVFDELLTAVNLDFLTEGEVNTFLENKPVNTEIILTGRNKSCFFHEKANYITYMEKIKHPFDNGISSRHGIEF